MHRWQKNFLSSLILVALAPIKASFPADAAGQRPDIARRPNLIVVLSDQQSWDMLGCYGNQDAITPNFDRLAAEGVRFNHCVSNSPVCTPYRGILMSGQHPLYCGAMQNDLQILPGKGTYLGEVLRDAGYRMGYFGKWHLYGGDRVRPVPPGEYRYGFDHEFLTNNCTLLFDAARAYYWDAQGRRQLYGDWEPYAQTRQAMQFIDAHAHEPFALFISWHPPHNWGNEHEGYEAPEDCVALYDPARLHLRPTVQDTPSVRRMYQGHLAMINSLDRAFGWLMEDVSRKGLANNTLVVFTADHGDMLSSYGWTQHKGRPEDASCRVPLVIRFPGQLKPRTSELLVGAMDLMPTLLGLVGLPVPQTCQGRNLASAIREERDDAVESLPLLLLAGNWRGIYTRRYTYSFSIKSEKDAKARPFTYDFLYDRNADPCETKNLFESPEHRELRNQLHRQTLAWMERFGDRGATFDLLRRTAVRAEDLPAVCLPPQRRPRGWEGRLKGRPIDCLPDAKGSE